MSANAEIRLSGVSRFYGDVLGINRVDLELQPGITGLVGPNGSGKSTLMNLLAGLIRPSRGELSVFGHTRRDPHLMFGNIGYCTQYDAFPQGMSGRAFIRNFLQVHGYSAIQAATLAEAALQRVSLTDAGDDAVEGYSKGMRQRIKLALAIAHQPRLLILDEPLNGMDPMARAEVIELLREFSNDGAYVLISSHILHEVDLISDRVVFLNNGYVVAEGEVQGIKEEMAQPDPGPAEPAAADPVEPAAAPAPAATPSDAPVPVPMQVVIRCPQAREIAAQTFATGTVEAAQLTDNGSGVLVHTADSDNFFLSFNKLVLEQQWLIESIRPADESVEAVYQSLVVDEGQPVAAR